MKESHASRHWQRPGHKPSISNLPLATGFPDPLFPRKYLSYHGPAGWLDRLYSWMIWKIQYSGAILMKSIAIGDLWTGIHGVQKQCVVDFSWLPKVHPIFVYKTRPRLFKNHWQVVSVRDSWYFRKAICHRTHDTEGGRMAKLWDDFPWLESVLAERYVVRLERLDYTIDWVSYMDSGR